MTSTPRSAPGLLPPTDGRDHLLVMVVGLICLMSCLTLLGVIMADRAVRGWSEHLQGQATLTVQPSPGETSDQTVQRAAKVVKEMDGVSTVRVLALPARTSGGRQLIIDLAPSAQTRPVALEAVLKRAGIVASVDSQLVWADDMAQAAGLVRGFGLGLCGLMILATGTIIALSTRSALADSTNLIRVMIQAGARPGFIASLFQARFAKIAGLGGSLGAGGAALVGAMMCLAASPDGLAPNLPLSWPDLLFLLPAPLFAALVGALVARQTAMTLIRALA